MPETLKQLKNAVLVGLDGVYPEFLECHLAELLVLEVFEEKGTSGWLRFGFHNLIRLIPGQIAWPKTRAYFPLLNHHNGCNRFNRDQCGPEQKDAPGKQKALGYL